MNNHNYYVYINTNQRHSVFYIGVTDNLQRRQYEHKNKLISGFTKKYNVDKLVYYKYFTDIKSAIIEEKKLKGWIRKRKIELINKHNLGWKELLVMDGCMK
ncbi:MAG: GIY-YIG nuclease family protein [bacterium]